MKHLLNCIIILVPLFLIAQTPKFVWSQPETIISSKYYEQIDSNEFSYSMRYNTGITYKDKNGKIYVNFEDDQLQIKTTVLEEKLVYLNIQTYNEIPFDEYVIQLTIIKDLLLIEKKDRKNQVVKSLEIPASYHFVDRKGKYLFLEKITRDEPISVKIIDLEIMELFYEQQFKFPGGYDHLKIIDSYIEESGNVFYAFAPMESHKEGKQSTDKENGELIMINE